MKKKLLSAILAMSMVMGLAACGNNGPVPTATESGDTSAATETPAATEAPAAEATDTVAGIDGWEPFADQVTLRVAVYDRGDAGN